MDCNLVWEDKGIYIAYSGTIVGSDIDKLNREIHGDIRFDTHKYQIWNFLEADCMQVDIVDAKTFAATDAIASRSTPNVKIAVVTTDEHMSRIVQEYTDCIKTTFSSPWEVRVFEAESDARDWI